MGKKLPAGSTDTAQSRGKKKTKGRQSAAGSGKVLEAASLLAVGLAVSSEAAAAIRSDSTLENMGLSAVSGSESLPAELLAEQLAELQSAESEPKGAAEGAEDKIAADAEEVEGEIAAEGTGASSEPVQLADASEALGIVSERPIELGQQPMQLAQAQTSSGSGGSGAAGAEAAGGAAAGTEAAGAGAGADAAAAGLAAGPGAIGIAAIAVGVAAAAGGGGGAAAAAAAVGAPVLGFAAKGPLNGATVFYDMNGNGVLDAGDIQTTTNATGGFSFSAADALAAAGKKLIVQGGTYTKADGSTVAFNGKLIAASGTAVTPASTLLAAGVSASDLGAILGKDPNSLTAADFNPASAASIEDEALALFNLIDKYTSSTDDADKVLLLAKALGTALAGARAAGADLSDPDVMANINTLLDGVLETLAANLDSDPTFSESDPLYQALVDAVATEIVSEGATLNSAGAVNAHEAYAVGIGATWNGSQYVLTETGAEALLAAGGFSNLGTDAGAVAPVVLQAEGTLLGDLGNLLTGDQLASLGIDVIQADSAAPYLHLLAGNLASGSNGMGGTVASIGGNAIAVGTDFSDNGTALNALGVDVTLLGDDAVFGSGGTTGD